MSRKPAPTLAERPPTVDELSLVALARSLGLDHLEAVRRLAVPVEQDEGGCWHRTGRPAPEYLKLYRG